MTDAKVEARHRKTAAALNEPLAEAINVAEETAIVAQTCATTEAQVLAEVADALSNGATELYELWRKLGRSDKPWPTWPQFLGEWIRSGAWRDKP